MGPRSKTQRGKNCCGWQSSAGQIQDFAQTLSSSVSRPPDFLSRFIWLQYPTVTVRSEKMHLIFFLRGGCIIDAPKLRSAMNGSQPKHVHKQCWRSTWIGCICVCYVHLISSYFIYVIFLFIFNSYGCSWLVTCWWYLGSLSWRPCWLRHLHWYQRPEMCGNRAGHSGVVRTWVARNVGNGDGLLEMTNIMQHLWDF